MSTLIDLTTDDIRRAAQLIATALPGSDPVAVERATANWLTDTVDVILTGAAYFALDPKSGFSKNFIGLLEWESGRRPVSQAIELAALEDCVAAWRQDRANWMDEFGDDLPYPHDETLADLEHARDAMAEAQR
jgi:hypothetical protein